MKIKAAKLLLAVIASGALVTGCATSNHMASGGMGNDVETGSGGPSSRDVFGSTAPNGSISAGNPFGLGTAGGMTR